MKQSFADGAMRIYDPKNIPLDELFGYSKKVQAAVGLGLFVAEQGISRKTLVLGYPGTGKTIFPYAVVRQLNGKSYNQNFSLLTVDCDKIVSSKRYKKEYYRAQAVIRMQTPAVIAYDEIEGVAPSLQKTKHGSAAEWYSRALRKALSPDREKQGKILILCITNYPRKIEDSTVTRFDSAIYFHPTKEDTIAEIIKSRLKPKNAKAVAKILVKRRKDIGFSTLGFSVNDACTGLLALSDYITDLSKKPAKEVADLLFSLIGPGALTSKVTAYENKHKPWKVVAKSSEELWAGLAELKKRASGSSSPSVTE